MNQLIKTTAGINDSNINTRLALPENEDELYQLTKTINELLGRIDISIQQQKQFTADASHEIRTPLAAMRGTLEILLRKKRTPEVYEEKIKEVVYQTDRLNQILEQLLQLARLESGAIKQQSLGLNKLVKESELKFAKQLLEKSMQVKINISDTATVIADNIYLSLIIDNLLSNAIKYGLAKGQITCNWNNALNTFSITNDGPGISQLQVPLLFNRFYRTDESRSSQVPGAGLGLAIVKKLADLQRIVITVSATPGSTTFSLQFPA